MPEHDAPGIVRVHVENFPAPPEPPKVSSRKHTVFTTWTAAAGSTVPQAALLLAAAPNRVKAQIFLSGGNAGDTVMLCGDAGSAGQGIGGATVPVSTFPVTIEGTDDVYISVPAGKTVVVGVISVYQA